MIFEAKIDELKRFLSKQDQERQDFIGQWQLEVREEMGLPRFAGSTIGVSFEPEIQLNELPFAPEVPLGLYQTVGSGLVVEVVSQDQASRLVVVEMNEYDTPQERLQTLSPGLFLKLFQPVKSQSAASHIALVNNETFEYQPEAGLADQMVKWSDNFQWEEIDRRVADMDKNLTRLSEAISGKEKDLAQMVFVETLFLFYILGNRLGYQSDDRFKMLHEVIFSLVDWNQTDAERTRDFYAQDQIKTNYEIILLFDPNDLAREPESVYLTRATEDHFFANGFPILKGSFLKARR